MSSNYALANFKSTGSTTARSFGTRAADRVNVRDYGAVGDGSTDDRVAIQAAIDAAFGTTASPHGYTNRTLNKPLYFPSSTGSYAIQGSLVFTHVYGGLIYGDDATIAVTSGTSAAIVINGMVESRIENLNLSSAAAAPCNIDLDWNGTWADLPVATPTNGLRHNRISNVTLSTADMGIRVAQTGSDGAFNTFMNVIITSMVSAGIELKGANALGNMVLGGGASCGTGTSQIGYKMTAGQFSILQGVAFGGNSTDIQIASNYPVGIFGGVAASTGTRFLNVSTGEVMVDGVTINTASINAANITGGKVVFDGCLCAASQTLTGTGGTVYIRGCSSFPSTAAYTGGGGTVGENI